MKHLRIVLLVLLAVLVPVRGAMAAAMLCPSGAGAGTSNAVAVHHHHGSDAAAAEAQPAASDHPTTCHFCASGCCMATLPGAVPSVAEPGLTAAITFPAVSAPVAPFQSDGQDRPPRTT